MPFDDLITSTAVNQLTCRGTRSLHSQLRVSACTLKLKKICVIMASHVAKCCACWDDNWLLLRQDHNTAVDIEEDSETKKGHAAEAVYCRSLTVNRTAVLKFF